MSANNGGPAFPVIGAPGAPEDYPGMTLRDYFAAKVLAGILPALRGGIRPDGLPTLAQDAYAIADAMLAAREPQA